MLKATWRPQKQRGTYQVIVRDGRVQKFTRSFNSKAEAVRVSNEINRAAMTGVELKPPPPPRHTHGGEPKLRDALPAFIDLMAEQGVWKGSTPSGYRQRLKTWLYDPPLADERLMGDLRPSELTTPMIGSILDRTRTAGPDFRSQGLREQIRGPIRRYYEWLTVKHGYRGPNPAVDLRAYMGKGESKRQRRSKPYQHFSPAETDLVLDAARKHHRRHLAKIAVMLLGGARYGEAAALELPDIIWSKRAIYLQRAWSDKANIVKVLKSDVCRYIPLTDTLADLLREHLADFPSVNALVFPGPVGNVQRHSSFLEHVWQPLIEKTGLTYRKIHATRHTFATTALEGDPKQDIEPETWRRVRDWLGHASVEETERYAHANSMGATDSLNRLQARKPTGPVHAAA